MNVFRILCLNFDCLAHFLRLSSSLYLKFFLHDVCTGIYGFWSQGPFYRWGIVWMGVLGEYTDVVLYLLVAIGAFVSK